MQCVFHAFRSSVCISRDWGIGGGDNELDPKLVCVWQNGVRPLWSFLETKNPLTCQFNNFHPLPIYILTNKAKIFLLKLVDHVRVYLEIQESQALNYREIQTAYKEVLHPLEGFSIALTLYLIPIFKTPNLILNSRWIWDMKSNSRHMNLGGSCCIT